MIVDSSALVAILRAEDGAETLARRIAGSERARVPAPCYVETCMVIAGRKGPDGRAEVDALLAALGVDICSFTGEQARTAVAAFLRYGKGRHPAGLNFGDCMAYAVAAVEGEALAFVGEDFVQTDVMGAGG